MKRFYFAWPTYFYKKRPFDYDHPTLLKDYFLKETSTRLIRSIQENLPAKSQAFIFIIPARSNEKITMREVEKALRFSIQKKIKIDLRLQIFILSNKALSFLQKEAFGPITINNRGYGNVRNLILITQALFGIPYLINLDDDELIPDKMFFNRGEEIIRKLEEEKNLEGVGGLCVDANFNPQLTRDKKINRSRNIFKQRKNLQQRLIDYYLKQEWTIPAGAVFGGINIMSRKLASNCCYDPFVPRGEDIDLVINAYFLGYSFGVLNNFRVIHLPPSLSLQQEKYKLKKDIIRFIYEKKKVSYLASLYRVKEKEVFDLFSPYPGYLLKEPERKLLQDAEPFFGEEEFKKIIKKMPLAINRYLKMRDQWPNFIKKISSLTAIKGLFTRVL